MLASGSSNSFAAFTQGKQPPQGGGSGRSLPVPLLIVSTCAAIFATVFSIYLVWKQLKNYRKPTLQRYVVRLLLMVPIYSIASTTALYSLDLADIIDLIRDLYEAFVIYCFFNLLIEYLGGERSLIILLHGRRPQEHLFPVDLFLGPMDASDPYTFLALKRGVLQYVQIKPILAVATLLLKSLSKYEEGKISPSNGYTWISFTYNVSVFISLYCLAMFWKCLNDDLKPFRVTSKFLCVKGIIFFSFWQGLGISILVAAGLVTKVGPIADSEYISMAIQDFMICLEMPIFALAHAYAFSHKDYIDAYAHYAARLPVYYALRDCIGMYDVFSDSLTTVRGTGYAYQTFEPSEGVIHQPLARERRSKAGLRYTQGGKGKYWLPQRGTGDIRDATAGSRHQGPMKKLRTYIDVKRMELQGHAPMLPEEADEIIHTDPELQDERSPLIKRPREAAKSAAHRASEGLDFFAQRSIDSDDECESLTFDEPTPDEDEAYQRSRTLNFGDYAYPNIDIRREQSQKSRRREDDEIVYRRTKRKKSLTSGNADDKPGENAKGKGRDRSASSSKQQNGSAKRDDADAKSKQSKKSPWLAWDASANRDDNGNQDQPVKLAAETQEQDDASPVAPETDGPAASESGLKGSHDPYGAIDLVIEDYKAEERERLLERRRGDPALRAGKGARIFRKQYQSPTGSNTSSPTIEHARVPFPSAPSQHGKREEPEAPSSAKAAVASISTTTPGQPMQAEDKPGVPSTQKTLDEEPKEHISDEQPLSKQYEPTDHAGFIKGHLINPTTTPSDETNDNENPWG